MYKVLINILDLAKSLVIDSGDLINNINNTKDDTKDIKSTWDLVLC